MTMVRRTHTVLMVTCYAVILLGNNIGLVRPMLLTQKQKKRKKMM